MSKCAICKENDATQEHHISYDPEMKINVCVSCHLKIHEHGVGSERGFRTMEPMEISVEERKLYFPNFTKEIMKEDIRYVVTRDKEEILNWLCCPNGCGPSSWMLYQSPTTHEFFIRCSICGFDARYNRTG